VSAADVALWAITLAAAIAVGHHIYRDLTKGHRS
jgi:hypothetical protein